MGKTDILIPLGKGSRCADVELKYCLRSIEKHLSGVGNIWIIGERPDWLRNVVHVPFQDNTNNWNRARNIYCKIIAGIDSEDSFHGPEPRALSDHFLFMNDDHFLLQDYEAGEFPYYHRGVYDLKSMECNPPQHTQYINTRKVIGPAFRDYGIHCPILYHKGLFKRAFADLAWPQFGYEIKSLYAHYIDTDGQYIDDLKFSQPALRDTIYRLLGDRPWFSVGDRCLKSGDMSQVLEELYPNKSKYESA